MILINIFEKAIRLSLEGMLGIFIFMLIFYFVIRGIDKIFPGEKGGRNA